ncbi:MAG TPA: hypothetical protein DIC53_10015 [Synergistaceae bacterium]|nr:hypothetical protein [Synergistaceae bacterium]
MCRTAALLLTLALLCAPWRAEGALKIASPAGYPLALVLEHEHGRISDAYLRHPGGVEDIEGLDGLLFAGTKRVARPFADGDRERDLVWSLRFRNPATGENLLLWVTALSTLSQGWLDLAPTAPTAWDTVPYRVSVPPDLFLSISPSVPGYGDTQPMGGKDVFSFVYVMELTKDGPTFILAPEVYRQLLLLTNLLRAGEPDPALRVRYVAMHDDYERIAGGQMPSRDAVMNFSWKRLLSFQWGPVRPLRVPSGP